ncbi:MAG: 3-dehydroquinate synthase [Nitrososphaerales archaeon]
METDRLRIVLPANALFCDIIIQEGLIQRVGPQVKESLSGISTAGVLADTNTARIFGTHVKENLSSSFPGTCIVSFKAGERSKNLKTVELLARELNRNKLDRDSILVAVGGGVVGDITGFVASIYKRGIAHIQVPTTLLAQVDSSIGGKTGVDSSWGKNQLGTFNQPRAVLIDPNVLNTLPKGEIINGVAEIVKSAIIADKGMFEALSKIDLLELPEIKKFIFQTCAIKAGVVSRDERESNLRSILNYGHTVGHAIEASSQYALNHGNSILLGMMAEGWIAHEMGLFSTDEYSNQQEVLEKLLPSITINQREGKARSTLSVKNFLSNSNKLVAFAYSDKKNTGESIRMSLPERIGCMSTTKQGDYRIPVSAKLFRDSIKYLQTIVG